MSRERRVFTSHVAPYRKDRGPNGRPLCRYCAHEVPAGRRTWCSEACVIEAQIKAGDAGVVCRELLKRDHGICSSCGADAGLTERVIERIVRRAAWRDPEASDCEWLIRRAWGRERHSGIRQLWEADHITPVVEGGGGCGLDGYRTLCRPCHKAETAALARRRAEARNPNLRLQLAAEPDLSSTGCEGSGNDAARPDAAADIGGQGPEKAQGQSNSAVNVQISVPAGGGSLPPPASADRESRGGVEGHAAEGRRVDSACSPGLTMQVHNHPLNDPESPRYGPASPRDEVRKRPAGIKPGPLLSGSTGERERRTQ